MYAQGTSVSCERSKSEIERTLLKYGATRFGYNTHEDGAMVGFVYNNKAIRFLVPMEPKNSPKFTARKRSPEAIYKAWEGAQRQKWRALNLVIKAKLEAVRSGICTFEEEFLAHIVLPSGKTVGESIIQFEGNGQVSIGWEGS